jgi:hypothetical protein
LGGVYLMGKPVGGDRDNAPITLSHDFLQAAGRLDLRQRIARRRSRCFQRSRRQLPSASHEVALFSGLQPEFEPAIEVVDDLIVSIKPPIMEIWGIEICVSERRGRARHAVMTRYCVVPVSIAL